MSRVVLDTGALWSPSFIREAAKSGETGIILLAVAYTERARQMHRDGQDIRDLERLIKELGIEVEDFGRAEGLRRAAGVVDDRVWERVARDAMIAGHVGPGDILLTTNAEDFLELDVPAAQIRVVPAQRAQRSTRGR